MAKSFRGGKYIRKDGTTISDRISRITEKRERSSSDAKTKRGFKGSDTETYTFYNVRLGYRTLSASSYEDALRKAKAFGYTRRDLQKR